MPGYGDVVEPGDRDLAGNGDPVQCERMQHADGGLVVRTHNGSRQFGTRGYELLDGLRPASSLVAAAPRFAGEQPCSGRGHLLRQRLAATQAVRAALVPGQVSDRPVAVIENQVAGEVT